MKQQSPPSARRSVAVLVILAAVIGFACQSDIDNVVVGPARVSFASAFAINGNRSVTLAWTPMPPIALKPGTSPPFMNGPLLSIEIHRSTDPKFQPYSRTLFATLPPTIDHFVDTALTNGTAYYYRIVPIGLAPGGIRQYGNATDVISGRPYDYDAITTIDYDQHIQPIFTSGCAVSGCHAGTGGPAQIVPLGANGVSEGPFELTSWDGLMKGGDHGALVIPYNAHKSHFLYHLNSDTLAGPVSTPHMPLPGIDIPQNQFQTLVRWVNAGAYNEEGSVALSAYPKGKVLITNQAEDLVTVLDIATSLISRYIRAGAENVFLAPPQAPHNVTLDKAHSVYYINLVGAGKVLKFSLRDNALLGEVSGISSPTQVALSANGDTGYVAQFVPGRNAVRLFRTGTMTLMDSISSLNFDRPHGVQVTPDGTELWVTGNSTDNLLVANLATGESELVQLNNQPPGDGFQLLPYQTVMTSDNRYVYVSCQQSGEVRVVDRATRSVVKSIPVGQWPLILAISPDNQFVYSANRNSNDVSVIRTSDNTVVATIPNVGPGPHGIAVTADGKLAYVSCENLIDLIPPHHPTVGSKRPGFVTVIDLTTNTVLKQIEVGAFAAGVAVVE